MEISELLDRMSRVLAALRTRRLQPPIITCSSPCRQQVAESLTSDAIWTFTQRISEPELRKCIESCKCWPDCIPFRKYSGCTPIEYSGQLLNLSNIDCPLSDRMTFRWYWFGLIYWNEITGTPELCTPVNKIITLFIRKLKYFTVKWLHHFAYHRAWFGPAVRSPGDRFRPDWTSWSILAQLTVTQLHWSSSSHLKNKEIFKWFVIHEPSKWIKFVYNFVFNFALWITLLFEIWKMGKIVAKWVICYSWSNNK